MVREMIVACGKLASCVIFLAVGCGGEHQADSPTSGAADVAATTESGGMGTGDEQSLQGAAETGTKEVDERNFYALLRETHITFPVAANYVEQTERSELVVRGTFGAIEGSSISAFTGAGRQLNVMVLEVVVSETLKGDPTESAYFGYIVSGEVSLEMMRERKPGDELIVFLNDVTDLGVFPGVEGRPEGTRLYEMATPQGLVVRAENGSALQPLLDDHPDAIISEPSSFGEVVLAVKAATEEQPP